MQNPNSAPGPDHIKPGRYRHYKGGEYIVSGTARHSETDELMVIYRTNYGDKSQWVRPLKMFTGTVEIDGKTLPRFEFISED